MAIPVERNGRKSPTGRKNATTAMLTQIARLTWIDLRMPMRLEIHPKRRAPPKATNCTTRKVSATSVTLRSSVPVAYAAEMLMVV